METLREAKQHLRRNFEKGTHCPCCGQSVKLYTRPLTGAMVYVLYVIWKNAGVGNWIHVENMLKEVDGIPATLRGDFPKLRYWRFLEKAAGRRQDGSPNVGIYRVTPTAEKFLRGTLRVPRAVKLYNNKFRGFDRTELVTANECRYKKFDFQELMRGGQ